MGKPDWKDAPEWAQWVAQDFSGSWGWYEHKPMIRNEGTHVWDIEFCGHGWLSAGRGEKNKDWMKTLERRP